MREFIFVPFSTLLARTVHSQVSLSAEKGLYDIVLDTVYAELLHLQVFPSGSNLPTHSDQAPPTHCALVGLLSCVAPHVDNQHVLSFEGPLFPRAVTPVAHKLLLLPMDVLVIDVLQGQGRKTVQRQEVSRSGQAGIDSPDILTEVCRDRRGKSHSTERGQD